MRFLGLLVLAISVRVGKSVFLYFNPDLAKVFLQIGLTGSFFIGPFCFFYTLAATKHYQKLFDTWPYHIGFLAMAFFAFGVLYPYQDYPQLWRSGVPFIYAQWGLYLLASSVVQYQVLNVKKLENRKAIFQELDVNVLIGCWIVWSAYVFSFYTSYIAGAISFTFLLYITAFIILMTRRNAPDTPHVPYENNKISEQDAKEIISGLNNLMEQERLFLNANLTLPVVAKRLGITPQRLSQILNDNVGTSFSTYLNTHRIENAKTMLSQSKPMKMDVLAELSGFNTQSTFYKAFKEIAKTTPAKYRTQFKSQNDEYTSPK